MVGETACLADRGPKIVGICSHLKLLKAIFQCQILSNVYEKNLCCNCLYLFFYQVHNIVCNFLTLTKK